MDSLPNPFHSTSKSLDASFIRFGTSSSRGSDFKDSKVQQTQEYLALGGNGTGRKRHWEKELEAWELWFRSSSFAFNYHFKDYISMGMKLLCATS